MWRDSRPRSETVWQICRTGPTGRIERHETQEGGISRNSGIVSNRPAGNHCRIKGTWYRWTEDTEQRSGRQGDQGSGWARSDGVPGVMLSGAKHLHVATGDPSLSLRMTG